MTYVTVYGLCSTEDNVIRYIGQTKHPVEKRLKQHLKMSRSVVHRHLYYWIRSVLQAGHSILLVVLKEHATWCDDEIALIAEYRANGFNLVNGTDGGEGATGSRSGKGIPKPKGFGEKISLAKKGKPGTPWTDEQREKYRATVAGRKLSDQHRNRISAALAGRRLSVEHKTKLSKTKRGFRLILTEEQEYKRKQNALLRSTAPDALLKRSFSMKKTLARKREANAN